MTITDKYGRLNYGPRKLGWAIALGDLKEPVTTIGPEQMKSFTCKKEKDTVNIVWKGCEAAGDDFTVSVTWEKFREGWQGSISYQGNSSKLFVEEIHFPVVDMPFPGKCAHLLVGNEQGWIYSFNDTAPDGKLLLANFIGMQLTVAMADDEECLYVDHRDTKGYLKKYGWFKQGKNLSYHGVQHQPCNYRTRRKGGQTYKSTVIAYRGTWYQASQYYREWALTTPLFKRHLKNNPLREIAMWLWNRGEIETVIPPAEKLQNDAGVPVALDWYWWHGNPYDTDYPHYWPPREGEKAFKKAIARLNKQKIYTQVYINGVAWDLEAPSFKNGGKEALTITRNGTPRAVEYNCYTKRKLGTCCGEGTVFHGMIRDMVKKLADCGLPGVYLDMITMSLGHECYNPAHKHAPGGGNYHLRGYRKYVKQIRKENPGLLLSSESSNENYMDLFESNILLCPSHERNGTQDWIDCVPVFSAVYHGSCALFGSFALPDGIPCWDALWPPQDKWKNEQDWNKVCPYQFYAELARTIIWGMQPTVCNFRMCHTEGKFKPVYDYMKSIANFYYDHREFLYDGRMLDPQTLECEEVEVVFLHRATFTTEQSHSMRTRILPAVMHSCWEAPDGRKALIMVNYTDKTQECTFNGKKYTIPARTPVIEML